MTRGDAVECPEFLELVKRNIETRKVKPGIKEHAAVTGGENESVAVDPARMSRIKLERVAKENCSHLSRPEGKSQMT
jgi:hypothetical protein